MRDIELWKEIYERYSGRMLAVCMRYCPDRDTAQDMMHDGFILVYKALDRFTDRGEGSMRAWIEKIMVNTCLQRLRKKDLLKNSTEISSLENNTLVIDESLLESQLDGIPRDVLMQFIKELPTGYRTVFNLYVFEEYSHKEIAKMLGINEKSSSSQLYRAKCILAKKITEYGKRER
ncbi:MAG: RNA polymerase sigma factor [Bacteroidales bacterium]|jgi:RNA polymerase sigma-70 factor (ECF subfamily)